MISILQMHLSLFPAELHFFSPLLQRVAGSSRFLRNLLGPLKPQKNEKRVAIPETGAFLLGPVSQLGSRKGHPISCQRIECRGKIASRYDVFFPSFSGKKKKQK